MAVPARRAGVGTRGPGESQLETDRRLARRKISLLRRRLKELRKQRSTRRKERTRSGTPTVALAGYTNVGKSTLLNALTGAEVSVENRLFETLDPTTRGFEHDGRRYLVTDTVGFIRRLPTQLVEGFASTLEETLVADLVLHVLDASESDDRLDEMIAAVEAVLHEIGADDVPRELVLNKIDLVDPLGRRRLANRFPPRSRSPLHGRQRRRAAGPDRRALRRPLRGGSPPAALRRGGKLAGYTRSGRRSRNARTRRRACSCAPACRGWCGGLRLPRRRSRDGAAAKPSLAVVARALQDGALPRRELLEVGLGDRLQIEPGLGRELGGIPEHVASSAAMASRRSSVGSTVIAHGLLHLLGGRPPRRTGPGRGTRCCCRDPDRRRSHVSGAGTRRSASLDSTDRP